MLKLIFFSLFIAVSLCFSGSSLASDKKTTLGYDYIEIAVADVNPDYSPFEDGIGPSFLFSKTLSEALYLNASYTYASLKVGGAIRSKEMTDWTSLGIGARYPIAERFHVIAGVDWQGTTLDDRCESGFGIKLGFRSLISEHLEFNLSVSYLDLVIEDIQIIGELLFQLSDSFAFGLRIRDYGKWDYSSYEAGLRYYF